MSAGKISQFCFEWWRHCCNDMDTIQRSVCTSVPYLQISCFPPTHKHLVTSRATHKHTTTPPTHLPVHELRVLQDGVKLSGTWQTAYFFQISRWHTLPWHGSCQQPVSSITHQTQSECQTRCNVVVLKQEGRWGAWTCLKTGDRSRAKKDKSRV